jgi:hypothetical protein
MKGGTKRLKRSKDGKYHCGDVVAKKGVGSRREVWNRTACKTSGGLFRKDLHKNERDRIVSKKKHMTAKREKRLEKYGYFAKKGKFGYVKKTVKKTVKKRRPHTK